MIHRLKAMRSSTRIFFFLTLMLFVTGMLVALNYKKIQYYAYYNTSIPEWLMSLRGEISIADSHVITTIGGKLPLRGDFPFTLPIIVSKKDTSVSRQIRAVGSWEPRNAYLLLDIIKPGFKIVEVGANYGYYALIMGKAVGKTGKVYAFEANPRIYKFLKMSVDLNAFNENISLYNLAISDEKREDSYIIFDESQIGSGYIVNSKTALTKLLGQTKWQYHTIPTIALPDALPKNLSSIDLLRMDAEGSEILVIKGAQSLIKNSPNLIIVMEWGKHYMARYGNVSQMVNFLSTEGFRFWDITEQGLVEKTKEEMIDLPGVRDMVISRSKPILTS